MERVAFRLTSKGIVGALAFRHGFKSRVVYESTCSDGVSPLTAVQQRQQPESVKEKMCLVIA